MKEIVLNNWKAKITCLILATVLWYLIKQNVDRTNTKFEFPRDRANETARLLPPQKTNEPAPAKTIRP